MATLNAKYKKTHIKSLLFNQLLIHISDVVDEYIYVFDI